MVVRTSRSSNAGRTGAVTPEGCRISRAPRRPYRPRLRGAESGAFIKRRRLHVTSRSVGLGRAARRKGTARKRRRTVDPVLGNRRVGAARPLRGGRRAVDARATRAWVGARRAPPPAPDRGRSARRGGSGRRSAPPPGPREKADRRRAPRAREIEVEIGERERRHLGELQRRRREPREAMLDERAHRAPAARRRFPGKPRSRSRPTLDEVLESVSVMKRGLPPV